VSAPRRVIVEPVRLPKRGGGYTSARSRAIDGAAGEVPEEILDDWANDTRRQREAAEAADQQHLASEALRLAAQVDALTRRLASTRADRATRNRSRRALHDLRSLARELAQPIHPDGGIE
jgi:hypothetical protein